ncbi:MAG: PadR family transcriptional regulator [Candidatus Bathyarchaeota archaeon]|nr:PadR family transcriptional regulator [Candidatus Bathyarchaeota archaeon]
MTKQKEIDEIVSDFSRVYMLTILYQGPAHGYEIIATFKKAIGKDVSPSLVYPFLRKLEQKNLVTYTLKPVGAKQKKVFELTSSGKEFAQKLFKRFSELISITLEPSLDVCSHCGCKVYQGGYKETIQNKDHSFCCIHCAAAYKQSIGLL